ncbi:MAG: hypothetical protein R3F58_04335 [Steroidobacteraceae bacterium]
MKIDPNEAVIPLEKLRDYLLSTSHPIGRYKSAFFRALGYSADNVSTLELNLRALLHAEIGPPQATEYGLKFAAVGTIQGPVGRSARIVSV